jgi:hypothetical protein
VTEIRFTLNQRLDKDSNFSISVAVIADEDTAEDAGEQVRNVVGAFVNGYVKRTEP